MQNYSHSLQSSHSPQTVFNPINNPISIESIFGVDNQFGIGLSSTNTIPWRIREDMQHFRQITENHVLLMGRKTWDSLGNKPLPNRIHIIFSNQDNVTQYTEPERGIYYFQSLRQFIDFFHHSSDQDQFKNKKIFCIGGSSLLSAIIESNLFTIDRIHLTQIPHHFHCDVVFPKNILSEYRLNNAENVVLSSPYVVQQGDPAKIKNINKITFLTYEKKSQDEKHPEMNYLNLIRHVLNNGTFRMDRTSIGTKSVFGYQMRIPIQHAFPLLTTKKMFWKGIVEELLWFLRGETNVRTLQQKGVHIWDGNTTAEYLETRGLSHYSEIDGECGPIYGFQFRHFGARYKTCYDLYGGENAGYDQVREVLRLIREEPTSRRIMISLWNPPDLEKQILPPCHVLYQFYVDVDHQTLSCSLYQRSGDIGLGIPFNISSASLMTYIFAHLTGLQPGELIHTIGDAHIYQNHIAGMEEQLRKNMYPWPKLQIKSNSTITNRRHERVEDFSYEDFELLGYISEDSIKMKMAT